MQHTKSTNSFFSCGTLAQNSENHAFINIFSQVCTVDQSVFFYDKKLLQLSAFYHYSSPAFNNTFATGTLSDINVIGYTKKYSAYNAAEISAMLLNEILNCSYSVSYKKWVNVLTGAYFENYTEALASVLHYKIENDINLVYLYNKRLENFLKKTAE